MKHLKVSIWIIIFDTKRTVKRKQQFAIKRE